MTQLIRLLIFAGAVFVAPVFVGNCADADPPVSKAKTPTTEAPAPQTEPASKDSPSIVLTDTDKQEVTEFETRVSDYVDLHQKLEASLPDLSDEATPEEINVHRQAMSALIKAARVGAKQGDFLTPGMQSLIGRAVASTMLGADDKEARESVTDENPGALPTISVNGRYPEGFPVSTMPVEFLQTLPKLPEQMEYRFLGKRLLLVDSSAQVILDFTPNVLP